MVRPCPCRSLHQQRIAACRGPTQCQPQTLPLSRVASAASESNNIPFWSRRGLPAKPTRCGVLEMGVGAVLFHLEVCGTGNLPP